MLNTYLDMFLYGPPGVYLASDSFRRFISMDFAESTWPRSAEGHSYYSNHKKIDTINIIW
jgi:hypothetical protein